MHIDRFMLSAALPLLSGAAVLACSGGPGADPADGAYAGEELSEPVAKPSFTLTEVEEGRPYRFREETDGYLTLLFFGYTHCPDICPVHMANLGEVMRDLPLEVERRIRVVFVSTDPERDTRERIREWLAGFHPSFVGLRGTREEVRAIEEELGLAASVVQGHGDGDEDYVVGHAAQVLAFEADDTARVAYPWGTRQRDWLRDLPKLVARDGAAGTSVE